MPQEAVHSLSIQQVIIVDIYVQQSYWTIQMSFNTRQNTVLALLCEELLYNNVCCNI